MVQERGRRFRHTRLKSKDGSPAVCEIFDVTAKTIKYRVYSSPGIAGRSTWVPTAKLDTAAKEWCK